MGTNRLIEIFDSQSVEQLELYLEVVSNAEFLADLKGLVAAKSTKLSDVEAINSALGADWLKRLAKALAR